MKIGLFDSGIGGLTVLNEFLKKYPKNEYIYIADNNNIPYGTKTREELYNLSKKNIDFLINKGVEKIIIACGTVSSTILSELKKNYDIEIYDVITPTINYIKNLKNVAVIATKNTANSNIFKNYDVQGCPKLVPLIEENKNYIKELKEYIKNFKNHNFLVLGCTHYPVLEEEILKILPNIRCINMGKVLVNEINFKNNEKTSITLYFGEINKEVEENIKKIITKKHTLMNYEN